MVERYLNFDFVTICKNVLTIKNFFVTVRNDSLTVCNDSVTTRNNFMLVGHGFVTIYNNVVRMIRKSCYRSQNTFLDRK